MPSQPRPQRQSDLGLAGSGKPARPGAAGLAALDAVSQALNSSLDLHTSLERGLQALLAACQVRAACVLLPEWSNQELEIYSLRQRDQGSEAGFRRVDLRAAAGDAGEALALPLEPLCAEQRDGAVERGTLQVTPICANGQTIGLLAAICPAGRSLPRDLRERLGPAIANARLYEGVRREADRLAAVNAVSSAIRRPAPVPKLLRGAIRQIMAVTDLEFAIVYLYRDGGSLAVAARSGIGLRQAAGLIPSLPEIVSGGQAQQPVVEEALSPAAASHAVPTCLMHVRIRSPRHNLGIITVGSYTRSHFAAGAAELLATMAGHIALGLDYALLYREARQRAVELARVNDALNEALHSKEQFLANVTHELKRPLAPARMVLETLLEAPPGKLSPQRQQRLLRNALNNLDSLNALVSELLVAARAERDAQPSKRDIVEFGSLIRGALAAIRPLAEERGLQVRALIPPGAVSVYGDELALSRVMANLLSNAVKFNREDGSVLVQLERAGGKAVVAVSDTGVGIPAHAQPHIFERFFQADASSTRAHEGMGLGLYIAREIVEQHGGQIRFDTQEGLGSTFTVTLPLA